MVKFDSSGERSDISMDLLRLSPSTGEMETVGTWSTRAGLIWRGTSKGGTRDPEGAQTPGSLGAFLEQKENSLVVSTVLVNVVL